jgi:hypothetical protein
MNLAKEIKMQIVALATIAGKDLDPQGIALNAFYEAVSDLPHDQVLRVLKDWLKTDKGFPYPSQIREKVQPEITDEDDAQDVASLIIANVGRCGYTNPEKARQRVGELGWAVVERMGGWKHLCEVLTHENEGMFRAQIRDLAETTSKRAKRGQLNEVPALPNPNQASVQNIISTTFKSIETKE